ncbi:MAG: hypothetical protein OEY86_07105 [Nitrospira sp.]|nr:hypothetical protein [Nitrospira sp.]
MSASHAQTVIDSPVDEYVDCENLVAWSGEFFSYTEGMIVSLPRFVAEARAAAGLLKILKGKKAEASRSSVGLVPLDRQPDFAALLEKRAQLQHRLSETQAARQQVAEQLPPRYLVDAAADQLCKNPAYEFDAEVVDRQRELVRFDREIDALRRAVERIEFDLQGCRGRHSVDAHAAIAPAFRLAVRRTLAGALALHRLEGEQSALVSRTIGLGYDTRGKSLLRFLGDWGGISDVQSNWQSMLRDLREQNMISAEELRQIVDGTIPASLESA